ncbi:MAG: hypothetical protein DRP55_05635 [Spirochaetes bacterium]|nr:MAG: hypothetical protein DRP55_05635 [Spirochaetota bacterium]
MSYFNLIIFGSGTCEPSLRRSPPGYLILTDNLKVLIDCGSGTIKRMLRFGVTYLNLDLILITHHHPDHISDLVPLIFASKYSEPPRRKDLTILSGKGFKEFFKNVQKLFEPWLYPDKFDINVKEMEEDLFQIKGFDIYSFPMAHIDTSIGFRIEDKNKRRIALSGDTDISDNLIKLAKDVDIFVVESSFPDGMKKEGHLTPLLVGEVAMKANVKKVVLTHINPIADNSSLLAGVEKFYSGDIMVAEDGMIFSL